VAHERSVDRSIMIRYQGAARELPSFGFEMILEDLSHGIVNKLD
jgi:hypothetical protein